MTGIKAIIVDDELPGLNLMKLLLEKHGGFEIAAAHTDPQKALADIERLRPDVLFTDMEMPKTCGIELARQAIAIKPDIAVVFITAHSQYALEAFDVGAVHYILKPLSPEGIAVAAERLGARAGLSNSQKSLVITALGGFDVVCGDKHIRFPTAKVKELFACFTAKRNDYLEKWWLCERLWEGFPPQKAAHNLHSSISRLKLALSELGADNAVISENGRYRLDTALFSCDFWELEEKLSEAAASGGSNRSFNRLIDLYKGDLFGEEDFIWAYPIREKIFQDYVVFLRREADLYISSKAYALAEPFLEKLFSINPCDESCACSLMSLYARRFDRAAISKVYSELNYFLTETLGVKPLESTVELYNRYIKAK